MNQPHTGVLIVEDNDFDVKRVIRGLDKLGDDRPMRRARDGVEALQILRGEDDLPPPDWPFVIILDLNMPRMGGIEFLDKLREDPRLRSLPVFVVTTSDYHSDVREAQKRGVNGYFVKPATSEAMVDVLRMLSEFWDNCIWSEKPL